MGRVAQPEFITLRVEAQYVSNNLLTKVSFNPKEDQFLCTSGQNEWKVWRFNDGQLKNAQPFSRQVPMNRKYTEHLWLDRNQIIGCTATGEMYYVEKQECMQSIDNAFMSEDNNSHVTAIQKYSKGFFIASDRGEVALWVRSDENNTSTGKFFYDWIRTW
jgi:hypothetical protein